MTKRVFIIHGWEGNPNEGWFPWLKENLEARGFDVHIPTMPNPDEPDMKDWINTLKDIVGPVDENTNFIGHSIGCNAILRFLEQSEQKA